MKTVTKPQANPSSATLSERVTQRAFAQMLAMIHAANNRENKRPGDPKVGGHPASCASSLHLLSALHLVVREPEDFVCCKPHASPVDHALHHLIGLLKHNEKVNWYSGNPSTEWLTDEESENVMSGLRQFPSKERPVTFQSYHAASDPDFWHFLPSGTVGIPPVCSGYLALAHRYARDHGWEVPENAHFWSLIGDSEFREGSLLEAMPDFAERMLGEVTWIIDYNRQNLDGTRIPNERGLEGTDCDRIERTGVANGWRVIHLRHGQLREEVFEREGGARLRSLIETGFSDYEFQLLALAQNAGQVRKTWLEKDPALSDLLGTLDDEMIMKVLMDLGGHDMELVTKALRDSKEDPDEPYLIVAHTFKGWGLECLADPANHSALPREEEIHKILNETGLSPERPFERFTEDSEEGRWLAERREIFRAARDKNDQLAARNASRVQESIERAGGLPTTVDIDLTLFPMAHTQWMWGQLASKLVRIGSQDHADLRPIKTKELSPREERWRPAAEFIMTMSPDVGSSTNISPTMDDRIYGAADEAQRELAKDFEQKSKHPKLLASTDAWTRHIRFEIAEANAMSAVGAFGKMGELVGLPFLPIMTVYDFFVKRALDQLYYDVYWGSEFILLGTPSGVTLSPEGAQHSWKSDIQMPNLITWEPAFAIEVDWVLSDAVARQLSGDNAGRNGVFIRGVTRGIPQRTLLERVRSHASSKEGSPSDPLKPKGAGDEWGANAVDESTLATLADAELLEQVRSGCLNGGWYIADYRSYAGYEPGENVIHVFAMGSLVMEALEASDRLLKMGIFANVIVVSSPELLFGILGEQSDYQHVTAGLGVTGDLHAIESKSTTEAGLLSIAGRRVPVVAICDGEAGLLDNVGSIVGVKQRTLAVRKFSKCGRPDEVFGYHHLDADSIVDACGRALSETALENLLVAPSTLTQHAQRPKAGPGDWRELWPGSPASQ
jgi:pyruvate dehydrogenase E1 component